MDFKKCSKCGCDKPFDHFPKNRTKKDGLSHCCLVCQRAYIKQHYESNKQYYSQKARKRTKDLREWLNDYKSDLKCGRCGEDHPACIDFHHRDSSQKDFELGKAAEKGYSQERLMEEIAKCDVLCSNCHRKHHWDTKTGLYRFRE